MRRGALYVLLLLTLGWHAWGLWQRFRPVPPDEAVARLRAGALDAGDRQRCLVALRDAGAAEPRARLFAAAAAIVLDDRDGYERLRARLGQAGALLTGESFGGAVPAWPAKDEVEAVVTEAALGEHWLNHFLRGQWLRATGGPSAAAELAMAADSARWSGAELGGELARAALVRVGEAGR